jgi:hypothetical protein
MAAAHITNPASQDVPATSTPHRFVFERDTFAFANELLWEYRFDAATGRTTTLVRQPKPEYTLRCFVLTSAVRRFFFHASFDGNLPRLNDAGYHALIRQVLARKPRQISGPGERVLIPGFDGLRAFSAAYETLLKTECGGAWRSYVLRSHWRMVLPISRRHQARTAEHLQHTLAARACAVVHLVRFPSLAINHGVMLYASQPVADGIEFTAYDPNDPQKPTRLTYHATRRSFNMPGNLYWIGGDLDVIEIYRNWFI